VAIAPASLSQAIPELRSGAWRLRSWRVTQVLEHPPNRIVFGTLAYQPHRAPRARRQEVVAKVYGTDMGPRAMAALQQLWTAGFRWPARHRVTRPLGYAADENILFQARAPGVLWADLLPSGGRALSVASAQAAAWLVRLQRGTTQPDDQHGSDDDATDRRAARQLLDTFPQHGLQPLTERLLALLHPPGTALVPSHGGYHPMNVFTTPRLTTAIDLDKFGRREAAYDVGYAIGRLLLISYFDLGAFEPGARAGLSFWRRYAQEGAAPWPRVAVQVARFLLQSLHFELCALRKNRPDLLPIWTRLMEEWLDSPGPSTLARLGGES
jgi:hypothetical protein